MLFWRRFSAVQAGARDAAVQDFAGRPLVAYCNHPSWWDPALLLLALPHLLQRRGFGPMDAAELERYGLFRRMGHVSGGAGQPAECPRSSCGLRL